MVTFDRQMDHNAYLVRIGYLGSLEPSIETLRGLQRAHLFSVPFENLDIHLKREIRLDENAFFEKIVKHRRGGFCYELNGLFASLLRQLGFRVTLLSARVTEGGEIGEEFDHLVLLVRLAQPYLVDVGFGDSFIEPLNLGELDQRDPNGIYHLTCQDDQWILWEMQPDDSHWQPKFVFTLQPRHLEEFAGMCHYHQTSPDSSFTRQRVCSLALPEGRITLTDTHLIRTTLWQPTRTPITSEAEFIAALWEHFGIRL
jgi:N-hydroxyarylamine O-acetyltransferase